MLHLLLNLLIVFVFFFLYQHINTDSESGRLGCICICICLLSSLFSALGRTLANLFVLFLLFCFFFCFNRISVNFGLAKISARDDREIPPHYAELSTFLFRFSVHCAASSGETCSLRSAITSRVAAESQRSASAKKPKKMRVVWYAEWMRCGAVWWSATCVTQLNECNSNNNARLRTFVRSFVRVASLRARACADDSEYERRMRD